MGKAKTFIVKSIKAKFYRIDFKNEVIKPYYEEYKCYSCNGHTFALLPKEQGQKEYFICLECGKINH